MSNYYVDIYKKNNFEEIEKKYNIFFEDKELLVKAFIHSSYNSEINKNYQRLEFLGDSVLQMVTSDELYREDEKKTEGEMTKKRVMLISEYALAYVFKKEGLKDYIIVGKSIQSGNEQFEISASADVFEALIAAIYLDKGYKVAEKFIKTIIIAQMGELSQKEGNKDYKTQVQQHFQVDNQTLQYKTTDMDKGFSSELYVNDKLVGSGEGRTKKVAEQQAAKYAIENIEEVAKKNKLLFRK